jgi:hypothetical protein
MRILELLRVKMYRDIRVKGGGSGFRSQKDISSRSVGGDGNGDDDKGNGDDVHSRSRT